MSACSAAPPLHTHVCETRHPPPPFSPCSTRVAAVSHQRSPRTPPLPPPPTHTHTPSCRLTCHSHSYLPAPQTPPPPPGGHPPPPHGTHLPFLKGLSSWLWDGNNGALVSIPQPGAQSPLSDPLTCPSMSACPTAHLPPHPSDPLTCPSMSACPTAPARLLSAYSSTGSSSTKMRSARPGSTPVSRVDTTGRDTRVPITGAR